MDVSPPVHLPKSRSSRILPSSLALLAMTALAATASLGSPPAVASEPEVLVSTDFTQSISGWGAYGVSQQDISEQGLCLDVPAGGEVYSKGLTYNGIAINADEKYKLSFTATTTPAASVHVLIGEAGGQYRAAAERNVTLNETDTQETLSFTSWLSIPKTGEAPGQIAFQLGAASQDYKFCIKSARLEANADPDPYVPQTGSPIRVNQAGYLPGGPKVATIVTDSDTPEDFQVLADDRVVYESRTQVHGHDPMSGLSVQLADFSALSDEGSYTLRWRGEQSYPFHVSADLYKKLRYDALNYFYLARSGIEIDSSIVGPNYARPAGHLGHGDGSNEVGTVNKGDYAVACLTPEDEGDAWAYGEWSCPEDYSLDVIGGWYDAGDLGKYVVNGGISVAQLLSAYERSLYAPSSSGAIGDNTLNLPERDNGIPDVLDEARWELEFMLSMQVPQGNPLEGMVHHKVHDVGWAGLPLLPSDDDRERRLHRPSTAATLNLAAAAAQGARLWNAYDNQFSERLLDAAQTAWQAALRTPDLYAPAEAGNNGGGPYDDKDVSDEFYWAAAELYLSTGKAEYGDYLMDHSDEIYTAFYPNGIYWGNTAGLGIISLAIVPSDFAAAESIRDAIIDAADYHLNNQSKEGFGTVYAGSDGAYDWGSNSSVTNNQIVLGTAYDLTGDVKYANAVIESMDYLLGRNALNQSYITGYGSKYSQNQHSRWFAAQANPAFPHPPVGSLAGGPNSLRNTWDPVIQGLYPPGSNCAPQACYVDDIQSWSTNEITINWNSSLAWVASFLADQSGGATSREPYFPNQPVPTPSPGGDDESESPEPSADVSAVETSTTPSGSTDHLAVTGSNLSAAVIGMVALLSLGTLFVARARR